MLFRCLDVEALNRCAWSQVLGGRTLPGPNMEIVGKSPFLIGFTSSNGWLVFPQCTCLLPPEILFPRKSGEHKFNGHSEQNIVFLLRICFINNSRGLLF